MQEPLNNEMTRLEKAEALVSALKTNRDADAERLIHELSNPSESQLFIEVGRLTRELHEAINGFLLDAKIAEMTNVEIPDAKERLNHVITMTQDSANRTLTAVEESIPLVVSLASQSDNLLQDWEKLRSRLLDKEDFKDLSESLMTFLNRAQEDSTTLHKNLSEVLMAQDFQDLTGQIIRRVINLVHDVEEKLVKLVRITGGKLNQTPQSHNDPHQLEGPTVPGVDQGEQMSSQDEVDDLLSSLGF
ncbi:MAG: protein phosphatase CheZ [Gammaproteobacteria bacterium]|nr:protein phosphatase CheZ [Gammaproteobacteria bacterium]